MIFGHEVVWSCPNIVRSETKLAGFIQSQLPTPRRFGAIWLGHYSELSTTCLKGNRHFSQNPAARPHRPTLMLTHVARNCSHTAYRNLSSLITQPPIVCSTDQIIWKHCTFNVSVEWQPKLKFEGFLGLVSLTKQEHRMHQTICSVKVPRCLVSLSVAISCAVFKMLDIAW